MYKWLSLEEVQSNKDYFYFLRRNPGAILFYFDNTGARLKEHPYLYNLAAIFYHPKNGNRYTVYYDAPCTATIYKKFNNLDNAKEWVENQYQIHILKQL